MDVLEAIRTRKSVRAFRPDPVPKETLAELMEICLRAPSWANTQPWEFAIVGGRVLEELKQRLAEKYATNAESHPDIPWPTFPDLYNERSREIGRWLSETLGIARDDRDKRQQLWVSGARFFEASAGIIIYIDRALSTYPVMDVGMMIQTIMLGALGYGLGTCPEAMVVRYPEVLREVLHIPESKLIVIGLAIGYADTESPINKFRSKREPLETLVTWHGFD